MTLDQIKEAVFKLDFKDLVELEGYIKTLSKRSAAKANINHNDEIEILFNVLNEQYAKFFDNHNLMPFTTFKTKRTEEYKLLVQHYKIVDAFFKEHQLSVKKEDRIVFYTWLSREILKFMDQVFTTAPITFKSLLQQLAKTEQFVELAFPGYLRNGMFMLVIKQYTRSSYES